MNTLVDFSRFTPHGFCLAWQPGLIWLEAGSDLLIAAAYFSIPAALLVFVRRRRDLAFKPIFALFAAFILACGTTHLLGALTLWVPAYWQDGIVKAITAVLSVVTAIALWWLLPKALCLPSPMELRRLNEALAYEVEVSTQATARLRESEARLRLMYSRTPAALHAVDTQGTLLEVSDRWLEMLGYRREEVIGHNMYDFYTPESAAAARERMAELEAGSLQLYAERRMRCRDGRSIDVEVLMDVERDSAGGLQRVMVVMTDVTRRREAEAALAATEARLRHAQKMEAVGQLTGGIAHDFNNLLTTIMGSLELLQQRATLDERGRRLVCNALEGSRRAARLTSQLLTFSRQQRLSPEPLMPVEVVEGIQDLLARTLGDRIRLEVRVLAEAWPILADRNQVEAALLNLVINARDAISADGRVTIEIGNRRCDQESSGPDVLLPGDYGVLAVIDDGDGMTADVRARAFEPFFTTKPPGTGTGLGLSQIYGFVTQSGGCVRIETAPGCGTRIEMLLPRSQAAAPPASPAPGMPAFAAVRGEGQCILLVEDDDLLRATMADALRERGFAVAEAADAEQALHVLNTEDVALMFTDVMMPGAMSGVDLALVARERRHDLPVLFATGFADAAILDAWTDQADVMPKPYTQDLLAARIAAKLLVREKVGTAA